MRSAPPKPVKMLHSIELEEIDGMISSTPFDPAIQMTVGKFSRKLVSYEHGVKGKPDGPPFPKHEYENAALHRSEGHLVAFLSNKPCNGGSGSGSQSKVYKLFV